MVKRPKEETLVYKIIQNKDKIARMVVEGKSAKEIMVFLGSSSISNFSRSFSIVYRIPFSEFADYRDEEKHRRFMRQAYKKGLVWGGYELDELDAAAVRRR